MARTNTNSGGSGGSGTVTQVNTSGSITGGPFTTSGTISLVNDSATPGNSKYYGTNSSGTKGFFSLPSPGTGTVTSVAAGTGMSFSTITISGSVSIDVTKVPFFTGGISGTPSSSTVLNGAGVWVSFLSSTPTLSQVLTAGNTAANQSITHLNTITDNSANLSIDIGAKSLVSSGGVFTVDWENGHLNQPGLGLTVVDWSTGFLNQLGTGVPVLDWQDQLLISDTGKTFLDWFNSRIYAQNGTTIAASFANTTGQVRFNQYGSGTFTGTATHNLSVDATGNIIETILPKVYIATIQNVGVPFDPLVTVLENTIGNIVWTNGGTGISTGTLAGAFGGLDGNGNPAKFWGSATGDFNLESASIFIANVGYVDANTIQVVSGNPAAFDADTIYVEIRVYP